MKLPLLSKSGENDPVRPASNFLFVFPSFAILTMLCLLAERFTLISDEKSVGTVGVGSIVEVGGVRTGIIYLDTMFGFYNIFLFGKRHSSITKPLDVIQEVPFKEFEVDDDPINRWPYWIYISQDRWFTEQTCLGPLMGFCHSNIHDCAETSDVYFSRIAPRLGQTPQAALFKYRNEQDPHEERDLMIKVVSALMNRPASRLYLIRVHIGHTFLIEQYGREFRIYQSWKESFDLQYWTNVDIGNDHMCEPGSTYSALDDRRKKELRQMGIQDDTQSIMNAKANFGCLLPISYDEIIQLFVAISVGFEIQKIKQSRGIHAVQQNMDVLQVNQTKRWLGKSAINMPHIINFAMDFTIHIYFIEFSH